MAQNFCLQFGNFGLILDYSLDYILEYQDVFRIDLIYLIDLKIWIMPIMVSFLLQIRDKTLYFDYPNSKFAPDNLGRLD